MSDRESWYDRRIVSDDGSTVIYEVRVAGRTVRYHVDTAPLLEAR